eukprot:TRINITY_DN10359_c0_g2_i1.p1 TRINITY_DN10359_c0_g2~~TRINITY_DN10359_c0_g2_i1.p1  ORF type:complete len:425 (+),score=66.55 TRINITY_DN10359_c0_g2_i1:26-1276(+)
MTIPPKPDKDVKFPQPHKMGGGAYFFKYVSEKGVANLPNYQYAGSDSSLIYQRLLSPWLNTVVANGYVPKWAHPNAITVTGLLFMIACHFITAWYCPTFSEPGPWWVFLFNGVAQLVYWILDALDGKQARATKTSSPLGLLMDHGCDALNTTIGLMNTAAMLCVGPSMWALALWAGPAAVFFAATWEEYYVGSLDLPIINGPNEGVLLGVGLQFWTAYAGNAWWNTVNSYGYTYNTVAILMLSCGAVVTVVSNIYNVVKAVRQMKAGQGHFTPAQLEAGTVWVALSRTIPFLVMVGMAVSWAYYSPTDVLSRQPRAFLWITGLLLCKLVMTMMVAHLCDDNYHPFGKTFAGFLALASHGILVYHMVGMDKKWEDLVLFEFGGVVLISYLHMVISLALEISSLLNITIFTVPKEKRA